MSQGKRRLASSLYDSGLLAGSKRVQQMVAVRRGIQTGAEMIRLAAARVVA